MRIIKRKKKNPKNAKVIEERQSQSVSSEDKVDLNLSTSVDENLDKFKAFLKESTDVVFREFKLGISGIPCALVYVDGLVDKTVIHETILKPMMYGIVRFKGNRDNVLKPDEVYEFVRDQVVPVADIHEFETLDEAVLYVMSGEVALMIDGFNKILIISARGWPTRSISDSETEGVVKGPKEGFTETLRFNTALIRRKCKDPNMVIKTIRLGRRSKTDVAYIYIKGITNDDLIKELEERLNRVDIDHLTDAGHLEQLIEDNSETPLALVQSTERPDKAVANLMEGRIAILVDNSPYALLVPTTFSSFFQSPEDYNERWIVSSFIRLLRWVASFIAVFTPAVYIAAVSYHPGLIPTRLAFSISASRTGVPFPSILEALLMETTIELLRESSARLPKAVGQTIGIVGGLIIGESAVNAGLTSPIMVIIVSLTAIASFVIPSYSQAVGLRSVRFPLMILAGVMGLYGVMLGFIILNIHMVSLKSFGVSYMAPQAPFVLKDMKDFVIRAPYSKMEKRPTTMNVSDIERIDMA